jgi:hypothetical protein
MLREMGELTAGIDHESQIYEAQLAQVRMQLAEVVEPAQARFLLLERMVSKYVRRKHARQERIPRKCRFGSVRVKRGKVEIVLNVPLAARMKGKP